MEYTGGADATGVDCPDMIQKLYHNPVGRGLRPPEHRNTQTCIHMKIRALLPIAALFLTGCAIPFQGGGNQEQRAAKSLCDQIAAQAIQTDSAAEARTLAAQATECYARLVQ